MAQDYTNFVDPKLIEFLEKSTKLIIANGEAIDKVLVPALNKAIEAQAKLGKENKSNEDKRKKLNAEEKEAARIAKSLETTGAKIKGLRTEQGKLLTEQKLKLQQLTAAEKEAVKTSTAHEKSLVRMRQKLKDLTTAYDNTGKRTKAAAAAINKLSTQIEKAEKATNRHGRGVGGYAKQMKGLAMQFAGALGLTSAVFLFVNVLKGSFNTIREFTKQNAILAGVLGKTRKEVSELTDQAIQLGSAYPVTASEVNKLQVSFARLGFTQAEIIDLTEATIQGAIALNSELDQTATLVGAVVKAFQQLGTENSGEIIDKLTLATQRSSLSFSSLESALPKVAGAANAMGVSLDKVLVQLGIAHDATLDASISGTSLRNIYLELAKRGLTLDEALNKINTSSNRLEASYDLFGKRAAIVALALANNTEQAILAEDAISKAGGTAKRVAEEQMATLDGAIKGLSSSWEKLVLSFRESEGFFSSVTNHISKRLDTMSSKYTSTWQAIVAITGIGVNKATKEIEGFSTALNDITQAQSEEELKLVQFKYVLLRRENKKFNEDFQKAVEARQVSLAKQQEDADTRRKLAEQQAELQAIALAKEASEERIKIAKKEGKARVQAIIDRFDAEREFKKQQGIDEESAEAEIDAEIAAEQAKEDALVEIAVDAAIAKGEANKELTQSLIDDEIRLAEVKKEIVDVGLEVAVAAFSAIANLAKEDSKLKKAALIAATVAEKAQAVFRIKTATNVAATQALALPLPPPFPQILAGIYKALGFAQAAAVISRPIPQFAKGTNYAPGGVAELAERGKEMIQNPDGKVWMAENRGLYNLERGSKVLTNQKTEAILNDNRMVSELRLTRKAIQRQPRQRNESKFSARQQGYRQGYFDRKNRLN